MRDGLIDDLRAGPVQIGSDGGLDRYDVDGAASTMSEAADEIESLRVVLRLIVADPQFVVTICRAKRALAGSPMLPSDRRLQKVLDFL